jgi:hypothetical protein
VNWNLVPCLGHSGDDEAGFAYDFTRRDQQQKVDAIKKKKTLKKKIDKLTGKNRNLKRH